MEGVVRRFAAITGDVSSLHLDDAFARRSQYRRPVVHGMLPLAFLPVLAPLRREGRVCRIRALTAQFSSPVFPGDHVRLCVEAQRELPDSGELELDYRVVLEGSGATATTGTLVVRYEPLSQGTPAAAAGPSGTDGSSEALLTNPVTQEDFRIEAIEKGYVEPPLDFHITEGAVDALRSLHREGVIDPTASPLALDGFDAHDLLAILLFSTSVGVRLPGASATFLEFSARVSEPLAAHEDYRLCAQVTHRSRATTIVKKALTVTSAQAPGQPLIEGRVSALVNEPARRMPSIRELRESALDLGLRDKVVVVTGASRGIGETIAKLFALSGSRVVVTYHRGGEDAQRVVREIEGEGAEAVALPVDVTSEESVRSLVAGAVERFGTIDVLVNNAARDYRPVPFSKLTWDEIQKDLDVVTKGAFLCCRAVVPIMLERGGGRIVNVSSLATDVPPPDQLKYVVAKSALVGLTRSLALDLAPHGILVNMVVPHFVETDLVAHIGQGFRKKIAEEIPVGRLTSAAEVAQAVVFLASAYASFTTGQKIMVTGGAAPLL